MHVAHNLGDGRDVRRAVVVLRVVHLAGQFALLEPTQGSAPQSPSSFLHLRGPCAPASNRKHDPLGLARRRPRPCPATGGRGHLVVRDDGPGALAELGGGAAHLRERLRSDSITRRLASRSPASIHSIGGRSGFIGESSTRDGECNPPGRRTISGRRSIIRFARPRDHSPFFRARISFFGLTQDHRHDVVNSTG